MFLAYIALAAAAASLPSKAPQAAFIYHPQVGNNVTLVCADVTERGFGDAELWVTGFVSGMNAATYGMVGQNTTTSGLLGEVKLHCTQHPSDTLMNAVYKTYERMKSQNK